MPILVQHKKCTGCGACIAKCPKKCITYERDDLDNLYPKIDKEKCVECNLCVGACPELNSDKIGFNSPDKAYAAWSTNANIRKKSASGGAATALYEYAQSQDMAYCGVRFDDNLTPIFELVSNSEPYDNRFFGSKYAFCSMKDIFSDIEKLLKAEKNVFAVGLPCQIAALKAFLRKDYNELITADLICHGVCSSDYLNQHIEYIEKISGKKAKCISFRDPDFNTEKFHFTVRDDLDLIWNKTVDENDTYQIGYHKAVTYRENCYCCSYASQRRVGDITLADYWKIGEKIPFDYEKSNVSLVLANTDKGNDFVVKASKNGCLFIEQRPVSESVNVQGQLNAPSKISTQHLKFIKFYSKTHDFEKSAGRALKGYLISNKYGLHRQYAAYRKVCRLIKRVLRIK